MKSSRNGRDSRCASTDGNGHSHGARSASSTSDATATTRGDAYDEPIAVANAKTVPHERARVRDGRRDRRSHGRARASVTRDRAIARARGTSRDESLTRRCEGQWAIGVLS